MTLRIRPLDRQTESAMVLSSWLRSSARSKFAEMMAKETYYAEHHHIVGGLLASGDVHFLAAELEEAPGEVLGWVCYDRYNTLHFAYVKQVYRRRSLCTRLVMHAAVNDRLALPEGGSWSCSHWTRICDRIPSAKRFAFNPYLAFQHLGGHS